MPVNLNFSHSVSQQIYTAQEIARTGTITTIGFKSVSQSGGATEPQTRYIDLYLVKTNKKEFTSDEDWVSVSESDKVFSGSVTFALDDWTSIRLSKPFEYDGLENLCLVANDKTGSSGKKVYWSVYNDKRETGIYFAGGSSPHNPASLPAADWRVSYKNQLQLTFVGGDSFEPSLDPRVVEIKGDETSASSVLPTTSAAKHSLSQQIYTKDELGEPKDLTSISFFNSGEKRIRSISIYLVHTNKKQFAITNPDGNKSNYWVSFAAADRVFDGEVTFEAADWTAIRLNKTFGYNGSDNLALIVVDDTWTNPSGMACSVFSTQAENQSLSVHSDDEAFDAEHIGEYFGTPEWVKNVVRFNEEDTKVKPTSIEVSNIEWNSALVTWESEGSKWNLQYRENRTSNWIDIPGLTSKSYKLDSLAEDTYYFVRVQVDGGSGNLSEWASTGFETPKRFPSPTDLAASHIRPNSVRLQWTDNSGASSWDIVLFDGENRKILSSNKPHCNVYDLEEGTEYQAWVRAAFNEAAEEYSEWAGPAEFTTLENNPAPSDIAVEPARFSATISWKGISESYNVMYRKKAQDGIFGFDDGTFQEWTTIDADGDGYTWATSTAPGDYFSGSTTLEGTGFADSKAFLLSGSFVSVGHRALTPDNYLVSPLIELGGNIRFYVRAQDANYANEHFGVAVSLTSNTDPDAFTLLQEWTLNANGTGSKGTFPRGYAGWYRVMEDGNPLLAPCDDGTVVNAFDAYLHLQGNIYDITEDCVVNTGEEDELITGASAPVAAGEGAIYNLAGMRLTRKQKGINIVGGRKVLVR